MNGTITWIKTADCWKFNCWHIFYLFFNLVSKGKNSWTKHLRWHAHQNLSGSQKLGQNFHPRPLFPLTTDVIVYPGSWVGCGCGPKGVGGGSSFWSRSTNVITMFKQVIGIGTLWLHLAQPRASDHKTEDKKLFRKIQKEHLNNPKCRGKKSTQMFSTLDEHRCPHSC